MIQENKECYSLCLQLFKRNSINSFEPDEEPQRVHQNNHWHVLSFYDGMCVNEISDIQEIISNDYCIHCTKDCRLRKYAIHSEKKRVFLLSEDEEWRKAWRSGERLQGQKGRKTLEQKLPLVAMVAIKCWNERESLFFDDLEDAVHEAMSEQAYREEHRRKGSAEIWYHCFRSLGVNDLYILLYLDDAHRIREIIQMIYRYCAKKGLLIKSYTTFGISRLFYKQSELWPKKEYDFSIRLLTKPGLDIPETMRQLKEKLSEREIQVKKIRSILGSYDIEIYAKMNLQQYQQLLDPKKGILGWKSDMVLCTNTHILFPLKRIRNEKFHNDLLCRERESFQSIALQCRQWLRERKKEEAELGNLQDMLQKSFDSAFSLACQRCASPQSWNDFQEVRAFLVDYRELLYLTWEKYPKMQDAIRYSISRMTQELYVLANERLCVEMPSSERNGNSIYEKGAYEKVIQGWTLWLNRLYEVSTQLNPASDGRRVSFMIVPYLYGQTKSLNHLAFNHFDETPKTIVVNLSVHEMFKLKDLLLTFAHEIGHYCGIIARQKRVEIFARCVCTASIHGVQSIWRPNNCTNQPDIEEKMDSAKVQWASLLDQSVAAELVERLHEMKYLDECSEKIQQDFHLVFWEKPDADDVKFKDDAWVEKVRSLFYRYSPRLGASDFQFETYGYRLSKIINVKCNNFISIIREINADLFMLYLLKPDPIDYLRVIFDQANHYLEMETLLRNRRSKPTETITENAFSQWYDLYMRLFCCITCFYIEGEPMGQTSQDGELIEFFEKIKEVCGEFSDESLRYFIEALKEEARTLLSTENGDCFCLEYLKGYGKRCLEYFQIHHSSAVDEMKKFYENIACLASQNSLMALNEFLYQMKRSMKREHAGEFKRNIPHDN